MNEGSGGCMYDVIFLSRGIDEWGRRGLECDDNGLSSKKRVDL